MVLVDFVVNSTRMGHIASNPKCRDNYQILNCGHHYAFVVSVTAYTINL